MAYDGTDPNYDYTAQPEPVNPEDIAFDTGVGFQTAEEIAEENSLPPAPEPGWHRMFIQKIVSAKDRTFGNDEKKPFFLNGVRANFTAPEVVMVYGVVGNPKVGIIDRVVLPPKDLRDMDAYRFGKSDPNKEKGGWNAKKFLCFMGALGFHWEKGKPLPTDTQRPSGWRGFWNMKHQCITDDDGNIIPRTFYAEVEGEREETRPDGSKFKRPSQIAFMKYKPDPQMIIPADYAYRTNSPAPKTIPAQAPPIVRSQPAQAVANPRPQAAPAPARQPQAAMATVASESGLDDV